MTFLSRIISPSLSITVIGSPFPVGIISALIVTVSPALTVWGISIFVTAGSITSSLSPIPIVNTGNGISISLKVGSSPRVMTPSEIISAPTIFSFSNSNLEYRKTWAKSVARPLFSIFFSFPVTGIIFSSNRKRCGLIPFPSSAVLISWTIESKLSLEKLF
ncbi:MAG: hypothetical protein BWX60_01016 [Candidatus Marinimicrobia bacterium ADurb.Bin030]|nr:MAG: hypothetical protein BWX60_01016 [Candidatus Marinimicrobia bacterium ADurb.Bin030]